MAKPSLTGLEAFAAVAAERLGLLRSALGDRLRKLEEQLGLRLLSRTTRSSSSTAAGDKLRARVGPAEDRGSPSGVVRINAGKEAARMLLRHIVPTYLARYPKVDLDLVGEGRLVDIVEQGFDAGVRLTEAVPRAMIVVRISDDRRFPAVAAPDHGSRFGKPHVPVDLLRHLGGA